MKADVRLEIDQLGLEAVVTLTPSAGGAELTGEAIVALLRAKGVKEGLLPEATEKAVRALLQQARRSRFGSWPPAAVPPHPLEPETIRPRAAGRARPPARLRPEVPGRGPSARGLPPERAQGAEAEEGAEEARPGLPAAQGGRRDRRGERGRAREGGDRPGGPGFRLRAQAGSGGPRAAGRAGQGRAQHLRASPAGPAAAGPGAAAGGGAAPARGRKSGRRPPDSCAGAPTGATWWPSRTTRQW